MKDEIIYDADIKWLTAYNPDWIIYSFQKIFDNPENAKSIIDDLIAKVDYLQSQMRAFTKKVCGKDRTPADYASFTVIKTAVDKYDKLADTLDSWSGLTLKILVSIQLMDMLIEKNFDDAKLVTLATSTFDTVLSESQGLSRTRIAFGVRIEELNEMMDELLGDDNDEYDDEDDLFDDEDGEINEEVMNVFKNLLNQSPQDFENSLNQIFGEQPSKNKLQDKDKENIIKFKKK